MVFGLVFVWVSTVLGFGVTRSEKHKVPNKKKVLGAKSFLFYQNA